MNRIKKLFSEKKEDVLNIFFTAGYPQLEDTPTIIKALEKAGADIIEIGMPYSDPMADGPVIQESNGIALDNGMTIKKLFEQLESIRDEVSLPILLMGYLNPVIQYGIEAFVKKASELGVDGLILPDLPMQEYEDEYKELFEQHNISNVFLITPQTSLERMKKIDSLTDGFIYVVSTNSTTGNSSKEGVEDHTAQYFSKVREAKLNNPTLIGFNIKDNASFKNACQYLNGAIIGSAFVRLIADAKSDLEERIIQFVSEIKE